MKISIFENQVLSTFCLCFCALIAYAGVTPSPKNNAPEEITQLFSGVHETFVRKNVTMPVDVLKNVNKIFAEGNSGTVSMVSPELIKNEIIASVMVSRRTNVTDSLELSHKLAAENVMHNDGERNISKPTFGAVSSGKTILQMLNETKLNFALGADEFAHANGTSSIKPRKGVTYNETVPRKGVDIEDFLNYNLPLNHSCFIVNKDTCYDVHYENLECTCCNSSNKLGEMVCQQPLTDCKTCSPINKMPIDFSQPCSNVCCRNISQINKGTPNTYMNFGIENTTSHKKDNVNHEYKVFEAEENTSYKSSDKSNFNIEKTLLLNSLKKTKLKPSITKVPYDSDSNSSFSKSKGERYVPIMVSIFILPLVGIFVLLMWKKLRELWDRRYYRKMDFLIDGMYNDSY